MIRPLNQFLEKGYREPKGVIKYWSGTERLDPSLTNVPGVYVIFSREQKFVYPKGKSRVIYIGMSEKLRDRINTHFKAYCKIKKMSREDKIDQWRYSRYFYMVEFDAGIAWFTTRGKQTAKSLERDIMCEFYDRYLALPVGNGAYSY